MMWFFAILIVLALGGVAVVASGYGAPMARVHPDRRDVTVPAGRDLDGDDLRSVRFSTAVRGYRMDEVDALLTRLAAQLERAGGEHEPVERPQAAVPQNIPPLDELPAMAEDFSAAMAHGSARRPLDFAPASLVEVDDLLDGWGGPGIAKRSGAIFAAGVYAGEVMVRHIPGSAWTLLPEVFDDLPVVEVPGGGFENPIGKAFKRAENGPEDSIAFHYEATASAARRRATDRDNGEDAAV